MIDQRVEGDVRAAIESSGTLFDIDGDGAVGAHDADFVRRLVSCELQTRTEAQMAQPTLPVQPRVVGERWLLVGILGRGGQATTYLGKDQASGAWVAVKELDLGRVDDWKSIELFEREAQALERLDHPSIPSYIAHFKVQDGQHVRFFLVQQFVHGADLEDELKQRGGGLDETSATRVRDAVFDILEYLHAQSPPIVHRDLKPSNLIRTRDGQIVLVDFGAVQSRTAQTSGSTIVGTTGYMPIEQYMGRAVPASDLYALGATLTHLMSGAHPSDLEVRDNRLVIEGVVRASAPFMNGLTALLEPAVERRVADVPAARAAFETAMVAPEAPAEPAKQSSSLMRMLPLLIVLMVVAYAAAYAYREITFDPRNEFGVQNIYPQAPPNAKRLLFVGNSHTYWANQPQIVARMVPEGQPPLWFEVWAWPAANVAWHVENDVESAMKEGWDQIVLQPQSLEPALPGTYFARSMEAYERLLPNGVDSIFWVPKARHEKYDVHNVYREKWSGGTYDELTRRLQAGSSAWVNKSRICPVGLAYARARREIPDAPLYRTEDGNKAADPGLYLTGLMLYGCIYKRDPAEVTYVSEALSKEGAAKLRKVASDVWKEYAAPGAKPKAF